MTSLPLAAVVMTLSGRLCRYRAADVCCRSCSGRLATGPSWRPLFRAYVGGVHACAAPVQFAGRVGHDTSSRRSWSKSPPPANAPVGAEAGLLGSDTQAPGVVAATGSRLGARTAPPEGTAGPSPVEGPATAVAMEAAPARTLARQLIDHDPRLDAHTIRNGSIVV